MSSGVRVIANGYVWSAGCFQIHFFSLQPVSCKLFVTGAAYTYVSNPFVVAGLILQVGLIACLDQALHLVCWC